MCWKIVLRICCLRIRLGDGSGRGGREVCEKYWDFGRFGGECVTGRVSLVMVVFLKSALLYEVLTE
jgi:hypothetical protein